MNSGLKAILYGILVIAVAVTGYFFFHSFGKIFEDDSSKAKMEAAASTEANPTPAPETNATPDTNAPVDTNVVANVSTNAPSTKAPADTNVVAAVTTNAPAATETNAVAKKEAPSKKKKKESAKSASANGGAGVTSKTHHIGAWTGGFLLSVILLGGMIAWDVSNYMGNKSLKLLYNDEGAGQKDPEYEQAEQVWADGKPLEAIRMMRDYYNKNPREIHVALRIAEIYEKDLSNFLAAALEYEEVLKKKLPDERWGWSAIHLCNLYFKLGQEAKSYALLQRIVKEYGETQAADKARKRLNDVDPTLLAAAEAAAEPAAAEQPKAAAPEEPKSNLPPGFRPKK